MAKQRYCYGFTGGSMQVENKKFYAGKDFIQAFQKGLDVNKYGMRIIDFEGIAVFYSTNVPDDEMWFIQDGKLVRRFKMDSKGVSS